MLKSEENVDGTQLTTMQVYPGHANFIVNTGGGIQAQFRELVATIRDKVRCEYAVWLEPEAECVTEKGEKLLWPTNDV